ncbi:histidinol-phosphate transaminase [Cohaesibacter celericrescens]|uniref:histidinol-phosphate transaminase n=1 Tax=Cohaesibacter celericrescens TaxID=2067669 RepID=UPI003562B809
MTSQKFILRSELTTLKPYNAGLSLQDVAEKAAGKPIAKLASNENPYQMPNVIAEAMHQEIATAYRYPDPQGRALAKSIAEFCGCDAEQVILGNGSEDLLNILARTILRPGDEVVTLYPSFPLHEDYAIMMGAHVTRIGLVDHNKIDVDALVKAVSRPVRLTIFANPMNPTGLWLTADELDRVLAAQHPQSVLCIDEAYLEFASYQSDGQSYLPATERLKHHDKPLLVLRTFSKAYGLAGLRIGYGLTNNSTLRLGLDLVRTPFNANSVAQAGAVAALQNPAAIYPVLQQIVEQRQMLLTGLEALGLFVLPSLGNFLFFSTSEPATQIAEKLICEGVIVKPWKQAGYENWLRVSVGVEQENRQFLSALAGILTQNT